MRALMRLYLVTLAFFSLMWLVVSLLPRYAVVLGADPALIGLIVSATSLSAMATRIFFGIMADRYSRTLLMRLGILLLSTSYLTFYLSEAPEHLVVGRLIQGLAIASFIPSSIASVVDEAEPGKVSRVLSFRALMISLGYVAGPIVGGILSDLMGYKSVFIIASITSLTLIPLTKFRDNGVNTSWDRYFLKNSLLKVVKERKFILIFISTSLQTVVSASAIPFLSSYLKLVGYSDTDAGLLTATYGLSSIVARVVISFITDEYAGLLALLGLGLNAIGLIWLSMALLPPHAYIPLTIIGLGDSFYIPTTQTLVLADSDIRIRASLTSIYAIAWDLGMVAGPIITGTLITLTGDYPTSFMYLTVFVTLSITALALSKTCKSI